MIEIPNSELAAIVDVPFPQRKAEQTAEQTAELPAVTEAWALGNEPLNEATATIYDLFYLHPDDEIVAPFTDEGVKGAYLVLDYWDQEENSQKMKGFATGEGLRDYLIEMVMAGNLLPETRVTVWNQPWNSRGDAHEFSTGARPPFTGNLEDAYWHIGQDGIVHTTTSGQTFEILPEDIEKALENAGVTRVQVDWWDAEASEARSQEVPADQINAFLETIDLRSGFTMWSVPNRAFLPLILSLYGS